MEMSQLTSEYLSSKKPGWSVMFQNVVVFSTRDRNMKKLELFTKVCSALENSFVYVSFVQGHFAHRQVHR